MCKFLIKHAYILLVLLQYIQALSQPKPDFLLKYDAIWVDSVFRTLTLDQKIGQLLMPRANYSGKPHDIKQLEDWVTKYHVGGFVFFASNPHAQITVTNRLQSLSAVPLLIGQDFEWGLGMRLDSADVFPYSMTIGAMSGNENIIEEMGVEVAKQCQRIGVHINYAPVADVNNNPNNPVINFRSFGENSKEVSEKSLAYMRGMQKQGILCTAKHFPGHGDTDTDSHLDLPLISHSKDRLKSLELVPFSYLIDHGLSGIMTAHLNIPSLEPKAGLASTFSKNIIEGVLRKELGFEGLVFTDAMEMKGAIKNYPNGEAMVQALLAGNDILETFVDVPVAIDAIKSAVKTDRLPLKLLDRKVLKILKAKSFVGLSRSKSISTENLIKDLNTPEAKAINYKLLSKSITCLQNKLGLLPLRDLTQKIAFVTLDNPDSKAQETVLKYSKNIDIIALDSQAKPNELEEKLTTIDTYDLIIFNVYLSSNRAYKNYGLNDMNIPIISKIVKKEKVITTVFGNVYSFVKVPALCEAKTILTAYQNDVYSEDIAMQMIFGALGIYGKLPVTISKTLTVGHGINIQPIGRLAYGPPELVNINSRTLVQSIDSLVNLGLEQRAFPGCVVEIAKDGIVIFEKAYGDHTYENQNYSHQDIISYKYNSQKDVMDRFDSNESAFTSSNTLKVKHFGTTMDDVYDLASLTKVLATTFGLGVLASQNKFSIEDKLSDYLPELHGTNKGDLTFKQCLTHTAGLKAWIPFWKTAVDSIRTVNSYVENHPELKQYINKTTIKPSFFKRIFGKKPKIVYNYLSTIKENPKLLDDVIKFSKTIWRPHTFSEIKSPEFSIKIADSLFMNPTFRDTIVALISASPLNADTLTYPYKYSDLHFYYYPKIFQKITGQNQDAYMDSIYSTLGIQQLGYNPDTSEWSVVPTEIDSLFRKTLISGNVHDEGAALLNGISGHAGLFGSANEIMKVLQMFLQNGNYGGIQYIRPDIIQNWTSYQYPDKKIRRGIGFDKQDFNPTIQNGPSLFSKSSYGHSGFTGTYFWSDPERKITYTFLSNRVYPTRNNSLINSLAIRQNIGNAIISSLQ
ncbi:MAG: glycoside hydrolase family 3 N-terminal domain-containing protein [Saprospiraceae bacterium]